MAYTSVFKPPRGATTGADPFAPSTRRTTVKPVKPALAHEYGSRPPGARGPQIGHPHPDPAPAAAGHPGAPPPPPAAGQQPGLPYPGYLSPRQIRQQMQQDWRLGYGG